MPKPSVSSFEILFRYGYGASPVNELNTFNGTYTKDMVSDPPVTANLKLSQAEKDSIYRKMVEIDFFSYPERFSVSVPPGSIAGMVTPSPSYYFKVEYDSGTKELWWNDNIRNEDFQASKLRSLIQLITNIIESKDEYKKLPIPKSGYL